MSTVKKVLRVGLPSRLGTLDPRDAKDGVSAMILSEVYETPFSRPLQAEQPEPALFLDRLHSVLRAGSADLCFGRLRPDVVFSDGTPLTSELVVKAIGSQPELQKVATMDAQGDRVLFRLRQPNPRFDLILTAPFSSVVLERGRRLLGTGPFMFPDTVPPAQLLKLDQIRLVKNPRYRLQSDIDEIEFRVYPASAEGGTELLLEAAKRGEIDFTYSLTSVDAAALRGYAFIPAISAGNSTGLLHFNCARPALADVTVRKALAYAIDRRQIAESTYARNPLAYVASTILPPMMGRDQHGFSFDLSKARALAESAGSRMPKHLSLLLLWAPRPYIPNPRRTGELIQSQLEKLGVTVDLVAPQNRSDFFSSVQRGDLDMMMGGWSADTHEPADFLEPLLPSWSIPSPTNDTTTSGNTSRWSNATMDAAFRKFRLEPTAENRAEIMKIVLEEAPLVPLIYGQAVAVYSTRVQNFRPSALSRFPLSTLRLR